MVWLTLTTNHKPFSEAPNVVREAEISFSTSTCIFPYANWLSGSFLVVKRLLFRFSVSVVLVCVAAGQNVPTASPSPATAPDLLKQGQEAHRRGDFGSAAEKYQAALQQDPKSGEAYAGLARAYLRQEKVDLALEAATKGAAAVPGSVAAHVALGEVYFRQARMGEAEKEFVQVVNGGATDARAFFGLATLYSAYSLHARAKRMLDRAHALAPDDPEIQERWMTSLNRPDRIRSLEAYLSSPANGDPESRKDLQVYLHRLQEVARQPGRTCRLVTKLTSTETPLQPILVDATHLSGFGLNVKINGQSSRLLLDTGAGGILINKNLAKRAGIQSVFTSSIGGIGDKGDVGGYFGYADSIKVGELEFRNCMVEVSDRRSIIGRDGLIGADVFSHYLVTIDFLWQKLKLEELPRRPGEKEEEVTLDSAEDADTGTAEPSAKGPGDKADSKAGAAADSGPRDRYIAPEMQNYTRIYRFGHDLLIATRVGDTPPRLFLIDTGAMFNTISPAAAREVTKVHSDPDTRVRGVSGAVKQVYSADKAVLAFSHFRQENQDLTTFDLSSLSKSAGTEVSGLLGFTTLRLFTLKIDYRDGLVDFVYTGPKQ
jgi:tetratricopeptide (TPR) repeat protein/predicted aspartyl protease